MITASNKSGSKSVVRVAATWLLHDEAGADYDHKMKLLPSGKEHGFGTLSLGDEVRVIRQGPRVRFLLNGLPQGEAFSKLPGLFLVIAVCLRLSVCCLSGSCQVCPTLSLSLSPPLPPPPFSFLCDLLPTPGLSSGCWRLLLPLLRASSRPLLSSPSLGIQCWCSIGL